MIGELPIPVLLSLAALLSNVSIFISSFRRKQTIFTSLRWISITLILGNFFLIRVFLAKSEIEAYFSFHLFRCVIFFIPYLFLRMAHLFSGRMQSTLINKITLIITVGFILLINVDYTFTDSFLISGWIQYDWGYWPILFLRAKVLIGLGFFIPFLISLSLLLQPKESLGKNFALFPYLLVLWWIGFGFNFLALYGVPIFPFGMAIDSLISIFFSLILSKDWNQNLFNFLAELLSAIGGTILCFLLIQWALDSKPTIQYFATFCIGMIFLFFLFHFFQRVKGKNSFSNIPEKTNLFFGGSFQNQRETSKLISLFDRYQLTKKEIEIAEMILKGFSKKQIRFYLDISDGTFRNHLSSLYSKTIDVESPNIAGDKFQRFLYFLSNYISNS